MGSETHIAHLFSGLGTGQAQCGGTTPLRLGWWWQKAWLSWQRPGSPGAPAPEQGLQAQQPVSAPQPRLLPEQHSFRSLTGSPSEIRQLCAPRASYTGTRCNYEPNKMPAPQQRPTPLAEGKREPRAVW